MSSQGGIYRSKVFIFSRLEISFLMAFLFSNFFKLLASLYSWLLDIFSHQESLWMFLVFMSLFPPLSLILCDIMSSPRDAVSLCLNYLFDQTQNIAASIHPVGYFSEQLPCTDTYMLACLLCWCGMSSASSSLASLQVSNRHECIAYSSFRAWLKSGDAIFPTGLAATAAAATGAADKVLV